MRKVTYETRCSDQKYLHSFREGDIITIPLIHNGSCVLKTNVKVITNKDCRLRAYTPHRGVLVWYGYNGKYVRLSCKSGVINNIELDAKYIAFVTDVDCILHLEFSHQTLGEVNPQQRYPLMNRKHTMEFIPQEFLYGDQEITGLKYYLMANKAITMTTSANTILKYPPYSIKVDGNRQCKLTYEITLLCSEGELANVSVSCIEAQVGANYSIVENLVNHHTGQQVSGCFIIPPGYMDLGLLISTPYGFSGDLGVDPKKDCVRFNKFAVKY